MKTIDRLTVINSTLSIITMVPLIGKQLDNYGISQTQRESTELLATLSAVKCANEGLFTALSTGEVELVRGCIRKLKDVPLIFQAHLGANRAPSDGQS